MANTRTGDQKARHDYFSAMHRRGGYVYIARSFDGHVKVGSTGNVRDRVRRLNREKRDGRGPDTVWRPAAWRYAFVEENVGDVETLLRQRLGRYRWRGSLSHDFFNPVPEAVLNRVWNEVVEGA